MCWLGTRLRREAGASRLADLGWEKLHSLFAEINQLGTANLVFTDGLDLVFYHDQNGHHQVLWTRRLPTERPAHLRAGLIRLDLDDAVEHHGTAVLFYLAAGRRRMAAAGRPARCWWPAVGL